MVVVNHDRAQGFPSFPGSVTWQTFRTRA